MRLTLLATLVSSATSSILWDGRFNTFSSSSDLLAWSWSNQVGPYQYYIHGSSNITSYINLSPSYKNPSDTGSVQGAKFTLDSTAYWNGQTMRRIELIPQTTAAIATGKRWYHFSIMRSATNAPSLLREHQICFFESHFTELKAGWISGESGTSDPLLRWDVSGQTYWSVNWDAGVWHNVAYEIDFSTGSVAFWHSTGADPLALTVPAISVSATSNGADWHLGVLELPVSGVADTDEDYYFSGVYIEDTSLTTSVAGPGGVVMSSISSVVSSTKASSSSSTKSSTSSTKPASSTSTTKTSSSAAASSTKTTLLTSSTKVSSSVVTSTSGSAVPMSTFAPAARWSQCGGAPEVFFGPYVCQSPWVCIYSTEYYSQCL